MNCPDGDAINQNVVVNAVDNGFLTLRPSDAVSIRPDETYSMQYE